MTKIKSWDEIPEFKTEDEEREFWETHSISAQLADDFDRPAQGPMAQKMWRTIASLNLDEDTSRRLVALSLLKRVDPQELVMRFIVERIYEGQNMGNPEKEKILTTEIFRPLRRGIVVVALLALGLLIVGCAGQQEEKGAPPPVAGSFVGEVRDANAFVAVVAAGSQEEEGGGDEREVRAYLCDGDQINEWFWGTATGNDLDLGSDGGSRLEGNLTPDTSTGQITLSDGRSFPVAADLATGVAGLYDVTLSEAGSLSGISESGGRLEGRVAKEPNEEGAFPYLVTGALTAPEGPSLDIELFALDAEPNERRWVVLPDGRTKGGKKGQTTTGWINPDIDS